MSKRTEAYLQNVPMKPYDLVREGLIVLVIVAVVVVVVAAVLSSPDYPTVRAEDVANRQPIAFVETSANILAGTDPDRRAWDRLRNSGGQRRRNALQHYREHSQPVQRFGVIQDRFRFFGGFPVNVELASGTLWQQP